MEACAAGDASQVHSLLHAGAPSGLIDAYDGAGRTPLLAAIKGAHLAVVRQLLSSGASLKVADGSGRLPLHAACATGNVRVVKMLLAAGAEADVTGPDGSTPWQLACVEGHAKVVDLILSSARSSTNGVDAEASEVLLHVYYLGHTSAKCDVVALFRVLSAALGGRRYTGCGVYHVRAAEVEPTRTSRTPRFHPLIERCRGQTAIEIAPLSNGLEWSFGYASDGPGGYIRSSVVEVSKMKLKSTKRP